VYKNCVFFGIVLVFFALFFSLVSAKIVSSNTEVFDLGNNHYRTEVSVINKWIKDENSVWDDFNRVVDISARNWRIYIEWNENFIELNPFIVYNDVKWHLEDIPEEYREQINWRNVFNKARYNFKWLFKARKLAQFDWVGFDVNSNVRFQLIDDCQGARVQAGEISFNYQDLLDANFTLRKRVLDNNIIEVRIGNLGNNGEEFEGDPFINLTETWHCEAQKTATSSPFPSIGYDCRSGKLLPKRIGYYETPPDDDPKITWRMFYRWDITSIPLDANVIDSNFMIKIQNGFTSGVEEAEIRYVGRAYNCTWNACGALFRSINDSTEYYEGSGWNGSSVWKTVQLSEDADVNINSHIQDQNGWFSLGLKKKFETLEDTCGFAWETATLNLEYYLIPEIASFFVVNDFDRTGVADWLQRFWLLNDFLVVGD